MKVVEVFPDAVPEEGDSTSHGAAVLTLQSNVPFPEFEMPTVWLGLVSPCVTENARVVGLSAIVGCLPLPFPGFPELGAPSPELPPVHPASSAKQRRHTRRVVKTMIVPRTFVCGG